MLAEISSILVEYGLSEKEAKAFLFLVGNNRTTAYRIAKGTGMFKSTCYDVLERLIAKGFVSHSHDEGRTLFVARDVREILGVVKSKEALLTSLLPRLQALGSGEGTSVKHVRSENAFLGLDAKIAEMAKRRELTFVYMLGNNPEVTTKSSALLIRKLLDELSKADIHRDVLCRGLWDDGFRNHAFAKGFARLGENRFLQLPSRATMMLFDGHVAFFFLEESPNTIEIRNKDVAEEMKACFEHLWKLAQEEK